ncbi:MAG: hypothetical protein JNG88_06890 [Phycisphaerales bacterium]|nr:hypothetical protein [Phycisphaerales bacterium]
MLIPAGYMLKRVYAETAWLKSRHIADIHSVSNCISSNFADYIGYWLHNGYWLFNRPSDMEKILAQESISRDGLTLFYYEIYEHQFDEETMSWCAVAPEASFELRVEEPPHARLKGFDVVTFWSGAAPECSPLSCNSLADELHVNEHCLFATLQDAKEALEQGKFNGSEPGPFRIFAVYAVDV